jgi:hypothetical protein
VHPTKASKTSKPATRINRIIFPFCSKRIEPSKVLLLAGVGFAKAAIRAMRLTEDILYPWTKDGVQVRALPNNSRRLDSHENQPNPTSNFIISQIGRSAIFSFLSRRCRRINPRAVPGNSTKTVATSPTLLKATGPMIKEMQNIVPTTRNAIRNSTADVLEALCAIMYSQCLYSMHSSSESIKST